MKIKKLLIILFIVVLCSSFIKYEHFYTFKLKFNEDPIPPLSENNIQIKNKISSNKRIWIVFTKSIDWNVLTNNWDFYINNNITTGTKIGANDSMMYFGPIEKNSIFSCKYKKSGKPEWISGKCSISPIIPVNDFDTAELTALEWTFNPNGNFNPDLSALEGINIKADMKVLNGVNCDTSKEKICKIDFNDSKVKKFISEKKGINSVRRPKWVREEDLKYAGYNDKEKKEQSPCGYTSKEKQDCIKCPFDKDPCKGGDDLLNLCYPRSISARWGCYKWWANPNNKKAKDWLGVYETGDTCIGSYRWVFDETGIYHPNKGEELTTLNDKYWSEGDKWDIDSIKFKCATNKPTTDELKRECKGLPVSKLIGPAINCEGMNEKTQLIFTIYDVLV